MSILSTIYRAKKYKKQSNGFEAVSEWQLGKDVEYDDGKDGQTKHGAIDGITSDVNGTSDRVAASIKAVNGVNGKVPFSFGIDADGNYGYIKAGADTVTPFKSGDDIINSRFPNGKLLTGLDSFVLTSNNTTYNQGSTITVTEMTTKVGDVQVPNGIIRIKNSKGGCSGMAFTPDYIDLTNVNYIIASTVYADTGSSSHTGFQMKLTIIDEAGKGVELANVGLGFNSNPKVGNMCANVYGYSGKYKIGCRAAFPEAGYVDMYYIGLS